MEARVPDKFIRMAVALLASAAVLAGANPIGVAAFVTAIVALLKQ